MTYHMGNSYFFISFHDIFYCSCPPKKQKKLGHYLINQYNVYVSCFLALCDHGELSITNLTSKPKKISLIPYQYLGLFVCIFWACILLFKEKEKKKKKNKKLVFRIGFGFQRHLFFFNGKEQKPGSKFQARVTPEGQLSFQSTSPPTPRAGTSFQVKHYHHHHCHCEH